MWFYLKLVFNYIFIHEKLQGCTSCKLNLHSKIENRNTLNLCILKVYLVSKYFHVTSTLLIFRIFLILANKVGKRLKSQQIKKVSTIPFLIRRFGYGWGSPSFLCFIEKMWITLEDVCCCVAATFWFWFRLQNIQTVLFTSQFLSKTSNYRWVLLDAL